jgi:predicted 3-demethylubiquinone-9 3-methyltransferase (glyoxalase superfamily)
VNCETQEEVDEFWQKLSQGGEESRCGWLKDKFGLSWQIVPTALPRLLQSKDPAKSQKVMHAMLQMSKIDIAKLEEAYAS